jgi:hypothetical protein
MAKMDGQTTMTAKTEMIFVQNISGDDGCWRVLCTDPVPPWSTSCICDRLCSKRSDIDSLTEGLSRVNRVGTKESRHFVRGSLDACRL